MAIKLGCGPGGVNIRINTQAHTQTISFVILDSVNVLSDSNKTDFLKTKTVIFES